MTADDVREMIRNRAKESSQRAVAVNLGVTEAFLCDVLKGRRDPGPTICAGLGVEKIVTYELVDTLRHSE